MPRLPVYFPGAGSLVGDQGAISFELSAEEMEIFNNSRSTRSKPGSAMAETKPRKKRKYTGRIAGRDAGGKFTSDKPAPGAWTSKEELDFKRGDI